jgi:hypothetical protein
MLVVSISLSDQFPVFFQGNCLAFGTFGNSISVLILGDGVCISTGWKSNSSSSVWNTPCPVWYSGEFVIVGPMSLSGQLIWILNWKMNCSWNSKSV